MENVTSIGSTEGALLFRYEISSYFTLNLRYSFQGLPADGSTITTFIPKLRSDYGTIIRIHPSALYWKLANVHAWISSPNLRYRSPDG